jgi:hypothetical protein
LYASGAPHAPVHTVLALIAARLAKHKWPPLALGDTCAIDVDS